MANPALGNIESDVNKATTVVKSATILVNGIAARIDAAVAAAIQNGATAAELEPLSALSDAMETEVDALAAAVQAHTGAPA